MNNNLSTNKKGFTLLELLISTAIFAITVVIGVDLFFTIVKVQKRTNYVQTIQVDARNNLEDMARLVRTGVIDYDFYNDPNGDGSTLDKIYFNELYDQNSNKILVIRDQDNNQYFFERVSVTATRYVIKSCVFIVNDVNQKADRCLPDVNGYANWETVTPDNVTVDKFLIWITPTENPFELNEATGVYLAQEQPLVTIVLGTSTIIKTKPYAFTSKLQITVSSRQYSR
ncbi:MAG: prepilin-type N-terminal cleavage/methylation domain-containing protein [Patescibacteria group bacterium]